MDIRDVSYCRDIYSVTGILDNMERLMRKFADTILSRDFKEKYLAGELIPIDYSCMRKMTECHCVSCDTGGVCSWNPVLCGDFVCHSCRSLTNFFPLAPEMVGKDLYTQVEPYKSVPLRLVSYSDPLRVEVSHAGDSLRSDLFTNGSIIHLLLEKQIPIFLDHLIYCFVCSGTSYRLVERLQRLESLPIEERHGFTSRATVSIVRPDVSESIFLQVVAMMSTLQELKFSYGGFMTPNFVRTKLSSSIKGIRITGNVAIRIRDFDLSSIKLGEKRIELLNKKISTEFFVPRVERDRNWVRVNHPSSFNEIGGIVDPYCLMINLMADPSFSQSLMAGKYGICWRSMWKDDEFSQVNEELNRKHLTKDFLLGKWIKADWVSETISQIRSN